MSAEEIYKSLQVRMGALGIFRSLGQQAKNRRMALRLLFIGTCLRAARLRDLRRRAVLSFSVGLCLRAKKTFDTRRQLTKSFSVGFLMRQVRLRDNARNAAKIYGLGLLMRAMRLREKRIRLFRLMSIGMMPMAVRLKGAQPAGFKYGQKVVKPGASLTCVHRHRAARVLSSTCFFQACFCFVLFCLQPTRAPRCDPSPGRRCRTSATRSGRTAPTCPTTSSR